MNKQDLVTMTLNQTRQNALVEAAGLDNAQQLRTLSSFDLRKAASKAASILNKLGVVHPKGVRWSADKVLTTF
jgi:hypothetical protein